MGSEGDLLGTAHDEGIRRRDDVLIIGVGGDGARAGHVGRIIIRIRRARDDASHVRPGLGAVDAGRVEVYHGDGRLVDVAVIRVPPVGGGKTTVVIRLDGTCWIRAPIEPPGRSIIIVQVF